MFTVVAHRIPSDEIVAGVLTQPNPALGILVNQVAPHGVADRVLDIDPLQRIAIRHVLFDQVVVAVVKDHDPMHRIAIHRVAPNHAVTTSLGQNNALLAIAIHRVVLDQQAVRAAVWIDSIAHIVAHGVATDNHITGLM